MSRLLTDSEKEQLDMISFAETQVLSIIEKLKQDDVVDQRWLAIAKTDLEKGFMSLSRSVTEQG